MTIFGAFGLASSGGSPWVADEHADVVCRVDLGSATISTYAGDGLAAHLDGTGGGGPATGAEVPYPQGLTIDSAGNLYILRIEEPDPAAGAAARQGGPGRRRLTWAGVPATWTPYWT